MQKNLNLSTFKAQHHINICGSKSESNRLLILQALYDKLEIENLSTSDDTQVLQKALKLGTEVIDIHHAGTAMRFLTAYLACFTTKTVILTGSKRMQNRPIKILGDALVQIGAKIDYEDKNGYPPLKIFPSDITKNKVSLKANVSSQYISALMLVAPKLKNGLQINLSSETTSLPYLKMTQDLMQDLGLKVEFDKNDIIINPQTEIKKHSYKVESDWSSASYFYSMVALSPALKLKLKTYKTPSLQGDSKLSELYKDLGVQTTFSRDSIQIENTNNISVKHYKKDLNDTPDLAQTIAVSCLGLGISCELNGLHTLKIKETDRLVALKTEMEKFGASVQIDDKSLKMTPPKELSKHQIVKTYNDHRMAMAFAPLSAKVNLSIENAEVVNKSYPEFWKDFESLLD